MLFRPLIAAVLLLSSTSVFAEEALNPEQTQAVETIVRDYLLEHPEVIVEALQAMQAREQTAKEQRSRDALASLQDELKNDAAAPVGGNPNGDVTVVEFFDYRCGYCKSTFPGLMAALKADGNVRYVLREFPILGPASQFASKAALAVWQMKPDRYMAFHTAMMKSTGNLSDTKVLRLAKDVGMDIDKLRVVMESPTIELAINRTYKLAEALNIRGTPAFIIGNKLVPGAIKTDALKRMIEEARNTRS